MLLVYSIVAFIIAVWLLLSLSAYLSVRWTRKDPVSKPWPRLWMALLPILLGYALFGYHLRFQMNDLTMNLSWPFAVPITIGSAALYLWLRSAWRIRNPE